jgi:hypothetical protein
MRMVRKKRKRVNKWLREMEEEGTLVVSGEQKSSH